MAKQDATTKAAQVAIKVSLVRRAGDVADKVERRFAGALRETTDVRLRETNALMLGALLDTFEEFGLLDGEDREWLMQTLYRRVGVL